MGTYDFLIEKAKNTPQTEAIPGRENEMIKTRSGAVTFDTGDWNQLRRCLLIGTAQSTYYASNHELSGEFIEVLRKCIAEDPNKVAQEIVYASDGRSINNSAPILALVLLSCDEQHTSKAAFREIFSQVIRTASHFYEFTSYVKGFRGFGKIIRESGKAWLLGRDVRGMTYQLLKYQQRHGYTNRDLLRIYHPKADSEDRQALFNWVTKGWNELPTDIPSASLAQIWWYEWLKRNPEQVEKAIREGRLTHEMAAPIGKMSTAAWQALFEGMPIGALLRNLGSLTANGVIKVGTVENLDRIESVLNNPEHLRKGRIHPIDVLKALKTYSSAGLTGKSRKTWAPVPRVIDALELALELSFETQEPTGKVFMHALDISGSMGYCSVPGIATCAEVAATMALATIKAEQNYLIGGFSRRFVPLNITKRSTFNQALETTRCMTFGGTDAAAAYTWAMKQDQKVDVFCFWTDSESWAGHYHPSQALAEYRRKINPDAKAIYTTLVPTRTSLVDPKDPNSWDFSGFNPSAPKVIQMIANGEV